MKLAIVCHAAGDPSADWRLSGLQEEDTEGQKTKLDGLKREKEKHDGEMRKVRDEIRKLEGEVANEPEQVDTAAITQQLVRRPFQSECLHVARTTTCLNIPSFVD